MHCVSYSKSSFGKGGLGGMRECVGGSLYLPVCERLRGKGVKREGEPQGHALP